jgi:TRAP-type C4-dicarboxylate transport system permease large subunit
VQHIVLCIVTRMAEIRFEVVARAIVPWLVPLLAAIALYPPLMLRLTMAMRGV